MALRSGLQTYLKRTTNNSYGILFSNQIKGALGTTTPSITNSYRSYCSTTSNNNNHFNKNKNNYYNQKKIVGGGYNNNNNNNNNQVSLFSTAAKLDEDEYFVDGKPTLKYVTTKPRSISMMRHEEIIQLCAEGIQDAIIEALVRDIMMVDQIEYDEAYAKFENEIKVTNSQGFFFSVLPNKVGLVFAAVASVSSTIMVFHEDTVKWFNEKYVTMEVPPPADLETPLEVASWSWSWMEPICGQMSFVLLCLQLGRSQMQNMGLKPYSSYMKERKANSLADAYPQYDSKFLKMYSKSVSYY